MDKTERDFIRNNSNLLIDIQNITPYAYFLGILLILLILGFYIKKKISAYLYKREKLISSADEYERKRNARNDLKVKLLII
jgi:hypothetical protein